MDGKKFVVGTVTGGVAYFFVGFVAYAIILDGFFEANLGPATGVYKTEMQFWPIILGDLAHAALLTYIFQNWAKIGSAMDGLKAGALVGFLMTLGHDLIQYDTTNIMNFNGYLVDIIAYTIISGVAGAVIALVAGAKDTD